MKNIFKNHRSTLVVPDDEQFSLSKAIVLHLFPGMVIMSVFTLLSLATRSFSSLPPIFWFTVAIPLGLIPTELGYLLYLGKQRNGKLSLKGIIAYQVPLKWSQYLWMIPVAFVSLIALAIIAGIADGIIYSNLFSWWPDRINMSIVDPLTWTLPVVIVMNSIFSNIIAPVIEEMYFRGYLLPRLERFGRWAILINTFLFALYHFWSPWHLVQRTISSIPLAVFAKYGSLKVSMIAHVLANTIGFWLTVLPLLLT